MFQQHGVELQTFAWTEQSKDEAVMLLRRMIRERRVLLCSHARLRSELSRLTRRMAVASRSRSSVSCLSPAAAITFSNAGNCPSIVLLASVRPPTVNTRWLSACWNWASSSSSRRRAISWIAFRGTSTRWGSVTLSATLRCAYARRWPSVATSATPSLSSTISAPAR